ncbi:acyloxyacyl hydrolase [Pseudoalteromonas aliena]|uniref:acyloxyacyl hydrolase n=1 Tax=Pseudoalteromonas aliena TaxID=247523 RepID=UPI0031201743
MAGNRVFAEFGIGLSLLDGTKFAGKNITTHYQFEDRIGIAMKFGDREQHSESFHYSNAGIKKPNPGLDFISLSYSRAL